MKIIRFPIMLFLNVLPTTLSRIIFLAFSGPNGDTRTVFRSVATYKALEVMYTYPKRKNKGETNISDNFWENFLSNARAVRNRLILLKKELLKTIKEMSSLGNNVELLSLGSGSARAVFEAVSANQNHDKIKIKLIDMNRKATEFSQQLARGFNITQVEYYRDYVQNLEKYCNNSHPNIIEMVGLLDYFPENQALDLIEKIYKVLQFGGYLITCNIAPNLETPFVTKGINWPLIYRRPEELAKLLIRGGFSIKDLRIVYEPLKIHYLAIAKK